ncbi:hypothetical protein SAY87_016066 [Trapa incisa]|uniref:Peptidase metallopeptidase domain-containing protein n=1 Tax=Trapa incisa TaxID=236973 RepID=A0AAN7QXQ5_9MYRT|nr:hypothetical protein SAY87_016066 [Trapa incisa]
MLLQFPTDPAFGLHLKALHSSYLDWITMRRFAELVNAAIFLSVILQLSPALLISSIPKQLLPNFTSTGPWKVFQNFTGAHAGDILDGLGNMKKYFQQFGYIPQGYSDFTDEFDDALEAAIKTYQRNFNLKPTGLLDEATIEQMAKPRCGNADIVNSSTSMSSGKTASIFHSVGHYSFFPGQQRWPSDRWNLTYAFYRQESIPDTAKAVFSRAFQRWAAVTLLTFSETTSTATADIKIGFFVGDHNDGEPFDGVLGTLAHAFSPTAGMLHLDGDEEWVIEGDVTTSTISTAVDLESVVVHEIGHVLGLGHSSVENSIMFPTISSRMRKVDLAADDIQGIQVLYGSNPNYTGISSTPTTTDPEREANDCGFRLYGWVPTALLAVGLGVLLP